MKIDTEWTFWTWLADLTMPGLSVPSILLAGGTTYLLAPYFPGPWERVFFVALIAWVAVVTAIIVAIVRYRVGRQLARDSDSGKGTKA